MRIMSLGACPGTEGRLMPDEPAPSVDSWAPEDMPIYSYDPLPLVGADTRYHGTPHAMLVSELLEQASVVETRPLAESSPRD